MVCILCDSETRVINSRSSKKEPSVWRRRKCIGCRVVFTSREKPDLEGIIRIESPLGSLKPFCRDKLLISLHRSLSHRKSPPDDASELTDTIIFKLLHNKKHTSVISKQEIIDVSEKTLKNFDMAAYTHYHAHHKSTTN